MTWKPPAPRASNGREELADWLEFHAWLNPSHSASVQDLASTLRSYGTADAVVDTEDASSFGEVDKYGDTTFALAEGAFAAIDLRSKDCPGGYPFHVQTDFIRLNEAVQESSTYLALLLLSQVGPTRFRRRRGQPQVAELFEDLSCSVAAAYMGGESHRFGWPRRSKKVTFAQAVEDLCTFIGEEATFRSGRSYSEKKDGGLDVVVVRRFPDRKAGQLIGMGQCASGRSDWEDKLTSLDPDKFTKLFFSREPAVDPVRLFFVPHRVPSERWWETAVNAGVLFDRCRMAHVVRDLGGSTTAWADWRAVALKP